jgi:outer membrane protein assembly factor BamA
MTIPFRPFLRRTLQCALPALTAMLICAAMASPATAWSPFEQEWSPYDGWQLSSFQVSGIPGGIEGDLKAGLAQTGRRRWLRSPILPSFSARTLEEDIARIRLALAREGYPAATVTPVAAVDNLGRQLGLTLEIAAGPMVSVVSTDLQGWPAALAPPDSTAHGMLQAGRRFRDVELDLSRQFLRRYLRDRGFAMAEVATAVRAASDTTVVITFSIAPGDLYLITSVSATGSSPDLEPVTRRLTNLELPLPYSETRLEEVAFDLRTTQLYRQVNLSVNPTAPQELELVVAVENARMRSLEASLGTWSDNPWMARIGWNHRNLLGGGKGVDVHAAFATHTWNVGGGLTWFGWLSPRARTRVGAEWKREDEDTYLSREWRLDVTQSLRLRNRDLANIGVSVSRLSLRPYSEVDRLIIDRESGLFEVWSNRHWDWTDDPLYPSHGGSAKLTATWSPPIGVNDSPYISLQGDLSLYRSLGRLGVLAGHTRVGLAEPLGGTEALLPNRRFYAGGYSNMRGYGRRQLGPRDDEGVPRGGAAVLLGGVEARIPLVWLFEAAVFVDAGQVWWRPRDIRLADVETAAGVGLDVRTPLGPVRVGYAWNLGEVAPGQSTAMAHIGVGYPW